MIEEELERIIITIFNDCTETHNEEENTSRNGTHTLNYFLLCIYFIQKSTISDVR